MNSHHHLAVLAMCRCPCGAHFCYICGVQWKNCPCSQWEEPRLYARAVQITQREPNPRRRLFELKRAARPQPRTRRSSLAAGNTLGFNAPPSSPSPESAWEPDFSDHSEWEQDWPAVYDDQVKIPVTPGISSPTAMPAATLAAAPEPKRLPPALDRVDDPKSAAPTANMNLDLDALMAHLRDHHECSHDKWRWIKGLHRCEECHHRLLSYIFECRQCMLQACNRCRGNRLS